MVINYYKEYSKYLNRDMEYKTYGEKGKIVLVFPSQDGRYFDYENWGMPNVVEEEIEAGKIQLVCLDSIDRETWSQENAPGARERMELHEAWYNYVIEELIPSVKKRNKTRKKIMTTGCSMGGFHSANFFFRRPDIFDTVVALSGFYHSAFFMKDYQDDITYMNSPVDCIANMPLDHPYIDLYNKSNIIICVGQGAWEDKLLESTKMLDVVLKSKGIDAWIDYWGLDVNHDWPWWKRQLRYFMNVLVENKKI